MRRPAPPRRPCRSVRGASVRRGRRGVGGLGGDEGGNLLLISGVLLVLGFVVLGGTLAHLNSLEGSTARVQRDGVVLHVEDLMEGLHVSLYQSLLTGQTNATDFEDVMRNVERGLIDRAARSGLYVSLVPTTEDPTIWWREDRCIAWNRDPEATRNGVVVGWTVDDLEETIAGVVYDVHATDGRQKMRFHYYAKMELCSSEEATSNPSVHMELGSVQDPGYLNTPAGVAVFREELDADNPVTLSLHPTIIEASITTHQWQNQKNIMYLDGNTAKTMATAGILANNRIDFRMEAPPVLQGDRLEEVTISVRGKYLYAPSLQTLQLLAYHPAGAALPFSTNVVPLTSTMTTHDLLLTNGPSGAGWTKAEIENTMFRLRVTGTAQPGNALLGIPTQQIDVDHFSMVGEIERAAYRLEAWLDSPAIPPAFGEHRLQLEYRVLPGGTADEDFLLQVYDPATDDWVLLETMRAADGLVTVDRPVTDYSASAAAWEEANLRIIDSDMVDYFVPQDQDAIEVTYMQIVSTLITPGS